MNSKHRLLIVAIILLIGSLAVFTLAGAAGITKKAYLPVVYSTGGKPVVMPTDTPQPGATPTTTPTITQTATPVPRHFENCAFRTGNNGTIAVPVDVTINGDLVLAVDDEIAIFTPDGSICAGMSPWDGENIAITAWGDNNQTEEIDGLRSGEEMKFRIWDKSANSEIAVEAVDYAQGDGTYTAGGIYIVQRFTTSVD